MTAIAKRLLIRGRVQGVGYRDAVVQAALEKGVAGWVRNRHDDSVEVFVQGVFRSQSKASSNGVAKALRWPESLRRMSFQRRSMPA